MKTNVEKHGRNWRVAGTIFLGQEMAEATASVIEGLPAPLPALVLATMKAWERGAFGSDSDAAIFDGYRAATEVAAADLGVNLDLWKLMNIPVGRSF